MGLLRKAVLSIALASACAIPLFGAAPASAAPPQIEASWVENVQESGATLWVKFDTNGLETGYRFEYISDAEYLANTQAIPPREGFFGAHKTSEVKIVFNGSVEQSIAVGGLSPATTYHYRPVVGNKDGTVPGPERTFTTQEFSLESALPDGRRWELVSPVEKQGGAVALPGAIFGGGAFQASADGGSVTYGSVSAFGAAPGAPPSSQYLSTRTAGGWSTENISAPLDSGAYGDDPDGAPYRLFSADLSTGLLFGGLPCRGDLAGCPAPNPVLPGSGAPAGYMAYYLRHSATGTYGSLLSAADLANTAVSSEDFAVSFVAASPDLSHIVLSSCAALTANATEVPSGPDECDPAAQNLYARSFAGLRLVNLLPGAMVSAPGAQIAAPLGAVSSGGSRVYWTQGGNLFLRDGAESLQVDVAQGGGGTFQTASTDGGIAFFTKGGHLFRFLASTKATEDLGGDVLGVLGASQAGDHVYYQDATGLQHWHAGVTTTVAPGADATVSSNYPPAPGTSRVSPDGTHLAFVSAAELTGFDNDGETEVFVYGPPLRGGQPILTCASCNPTGERPQGSSSIPGALVNGSASVYKPRALSDNGLRLFFDSGDDLFGKDGNSRPDVYEWEAQGVGDCARSPGCIRPISKVGGTKAASFIDASSDGADVFFVTEERLVDADRGSIDLYDARIGGGFAEPREQVCTGDLCQPLPSPPEDPDPGTLVKHQGDPPPRYFKQRKKKKRHHRKKRRGGKGKFHVVLKRGARQGRAAR